jgi:serine/threonine-protein kinase
MTIAAGVRRGEVFAGRYVLGDVIGSGGMGIVYSATRAPLSRSVAVKIPRPELADDTDVQRRFRREAILASRFDHPNIIRVLDFGGDEPAYMAMERVIGQRLGQVLVAEGALPLSVAVTVVLQLLAAVGECHAQGIVHGDVKSDNVLVERLRDGKPLAKLFDFGLAQFASEYEATAGVVSGTPEYLAPEVVRGGRATSAADIYACGIVLYELLCGRTPFAGDTSRDVLEHQLETLPVPLAWRCPQLALPNAIDDVIARALHKDPQARYSTCQELASALVSAARDATPRPLDACVPAGYATDGPTRDMAPAAVPSVSDADGIVVAFLERARALVDTHRLAAAILALEEGIDLAGDTAPAWRLHLTLAGFQEGVGDAESARQAATEARARAARHGSQLGCARANRFLVQLSRRSHRRACYRPPA